MLTIMYHEDNVPCSFPPSSLLPIHPRIPFWSLHVILMISTTKEIVDVIVLLPTNVPCKIHHR